MTPQYAITDTLSPDLINRGKELRLQQQRVVQVSCEAEQNFAAQVGRDIHLHLKKVEEERVKLNEPWLVGPRIINRLAHEEADDLEAAKDRIEKLLGAFQEQEQKRVEALKAAQKAEFDKLEAQRQVALKDSRENPTLSGQIAAEQRANELLAVSRDVLVETAKALRADGMRVRPNETDFEITDLTAAVRARPDLFKCEPRASLIKSLPLDSNIPGIRLFAKTKVGFVE